MSQIKSLIILTAEWTDGEGVTHAAGDAIMVDPGVVVSPDLHGIEGRFRFPVAHEAGVRAGDKNLPMDPYATEPKAHSTPRPESSGSKGPVAVRDTSAVPDAG